MRRGWKVGLAAAALAVAAVAVLAGFRLHLIEAMARRELAALGFAEASLRVEAADFSEARVADLRLGPGARADAVRLRYGLLPPRLARIEIDGLFLDLSDPDRGLLGRLPGGGGAGAGALPEIALEDARIEADTPQGRAVIALSGSYGREGGRGAGEFRIGDLAQGRFSLALAGSPDPGAYELEGEIVQAGIAGQGIERAAVKGAVLLEDGVAAMDGDLSLVAATAVGPLTAAAHFAARVEPARLSFRVEDGEAAAPKLGVSAQGLSLMLVRAEGIELQAAAKTVATAVAAPFALKAKAREAENGFAFELTAEAQGATVSGRGRHDPGAGAGQIELVLQPVRFAPDRLQPASLIPALAAVEEAAGAVAGNAILRWRGAALQGAGELRFDDVGFKAAGVNVEGLAGQVRFTELLPPSTAPKQILRAERIVAGAAFEDVSLAFRLDGRAGALEIGRLEGGFAGGGLIVANARIDPSAARNPLVVQVHDVDLAALLALIGLDGLTGRGRVSGALPLILTADDVLVENGEIAATGPGALAFRSEEAKQALASGGDYVELALQALENFRYEKLSLALDKAEGGHAIARLSTLGANPDVLEGHPFAINLTLRTDANALLAQALEAWRLSEGALATIVRGR